MDDRNLEQPAVGGELGHSQERLDGGPGPRLLARRHDEHDRVDLDRGRERLPGAAPQAVEPRHGASLRRLPGDEARRVEGPDDQVRGHGRRSNSSGQAGLQPARRRQVRHLDRDAHRPVVRDHARRRQVAPVRSVAASRLRGRNWVRRRPRRHPARSAGFRGFYQASRLGVAAFVVLLATGAELLTGTGIATAQDRPASPAGAAATQIGGYFDPRSGYVNGGWVEVRYGRPLRRGRDIFGPPDFIAFLNDGAPVWRAGANLTTRLITELPLVIDETRLEPGEYTMFIQLGPERWILIISQWPAQERYDYHDRTALFGAYGYTPDRDVLRTDMTLQPLPMSFEQLSWQFLDVTPEGGRLALFWDRQMASVPFQVASPETGETDD
ncbi:MAG: DUF2911 domain-containing protein [Holophagales bacterium]|nr:DUF2911 domain-containing protein [Holophagales bacterium]MYF95912.1 DUF2911 domain-containing protein [Holophagales bacterium]